MTNLESKNTLIQLADGSGPSIKLLIWDMDDTFWNGTISEGVIDYLQENHDLVIELTSRGIVSTICSKNDFDTVKARLESTGIWEYFVFPKIAWAPKGQMIQQLIDEMQLRAPNVLFVDDNSMNLEEARFYNPGIQVALPKCLCDVASWTAAKGKNDIKLSRLEQYKVLEMKAKDRSSFQSNNEKFLYQSGIKVRIGTDCESNLARIAELIERANQLNFTKRRSTTENIEALLQEANVQCGYVHVSDRYGDYGICGFYAKRKDKLEHFIFSCRAMNMGVEQWVYRKLGRPQIEVVGAVSSDLMVPAEPDWITEQFDGGASIQKNEDANALHKQPKIIIKGGCDLQQVKDFLGYDSLFDTEFNYASHTGMAIHREHSENLRQCGRQFTPEQEATLARIPFLDRGAFTTSFFSGSYDVYIYSVLMDYTQGLYKLKGSDLVFGYGDFLHPFTDDKEWELLLKHYGKQGLTLEFLTWFADKFEFVGALNEERFHENLEWMLSKLPNGQCLIILNGAEVPLENSYEPGRSAHHRKMNAVVDQFVQSHENVYLVDVRKHVTSENDVEVEIRHYRRHIYFGMSEDIKNIINERLNINFNRFTTLVNYCKSILRHKLANATRRLRVVIKHT